MPLYTISGACQKMVESEELKKFELAIGNNKISLQMGQMQTHCQLVMLRLLFGPSSIFFLNQMLNIEIN